MITWCDQHTVLEPIQTKGFLCGCYTRFAMQKAKALISTLYGSNASWFTFNRLLAKSSTTSVLNWSWFLFRKLWTWKKEYYFLQMQMLFNRSAVYSNMLCLIPDKWRLQHSDRQWRLAVGSWAWHSRGCSHGDSGTSGGKCGQWPDEKTQKNNTSNTCRLTFHYLTLFLHWSWSPVVGQTWLCVCTWGRQVWSSSMRRMPCGLEEISSRQEWKSLIDMGYHWICSVLYSSCRTHTVTLQTTLSFSVWRHLLKVLFGWKNIRS